MRYPEVYRLPVALDLNGPALAHRAHEILIHAGPPAPLPATAGTMVATACGMCGGDVGLWNPPDARQGYTHIRPGGGPRWDLNRHHDVIPVDWVPIPPAWSRQT